MFSWLRLTEVGSYFRKRDVLSRIEKPYYVVVRSFGKLAHGEEILHNLHACLRDI